MTKQKEDYFIEANITYCCHVGTMFADGENRCCQCRKIITENDIYRTKLTCEEAEFFDVL